MVISVAKGFRSIVSFSELANLLRAVRRLSQLIPLLDTCKTAPSLLGPSSECPQNLEKAGNLIQSFTPVPHFPGSLRIRLGELVIYQIALRESKASKLNKCRSRKSKREKRIPLNRSDIFLEIGTSEFSFCVEECRSGARGLTVYPPPGSRAVCSFFAGSDAAVDSTSYIVSRYIPAKTRRTFTKGLSRRLKRIITHINHCLTICYQNFAPVLTELHSEKRGIRKCWGKLRLQLRLI